MKDKQKKDNVDSLEFETINPRVKSKPRMAPNGKRIVVRHVYGVRIELPNGVSYDLARGLTKTAAIVLSRAHSLLKHHDELLEGRAVVIDCGTLKDFVG